ncbi:hypothetical protein So717_00340 [Roseobacter cerasinus]|uniref:Uncharacterized protein n=1 Tax=Roseobacter cerasinus TaxID=2602289 RepID=A0A640VMG8_9RHOB|nr:hypothetical protein [Roseobacter cerasinus]GFE48281.1 hypothetical protein So717_00340 [Roseobacter cerasinus]
MRLSALILAAALPTTALAGPDRVSILLGSEHFNATEDFREFNPGVFLTWEGQTFDYSVGVFQNSYSNVSPLVSISYDIEVAPEFEVGAFAGLAVYPGEGDRFDHSIGNVIPLIGLQARYRNVFAQLLPAAGQSTDGVLAFGLTFDLD